jgi:protocatechuate 3,4-dioxygenase beta subunit
VKQGYRKILSTRSSSRRQVLGLLRSTAAALLVGCIGRQSAFGKTPSSATQTPAKTAKIPSCVVKPQQTEGPYFVDEKLNRSDIRSDPSNNLAKEGTELRLVMRVSQISSDSCMPLSGATVDLWHCDALGVYSDVQDRSFDTRGKKFLRGYQVTDKNGVVQFITIYPGWYQGRTVHMHFKIRTDSTSQQSYEFTSQLYFDDSFTDKIYAQAPYAAKGKRTLRNNQDGIFQDGGKDLILQVSKDGKGYVGTFDIGLQQS